MAAFDRFDSFDPWDPAFVADPYPAFAELRARGRVLYYEPTDQWLVPHHADVSALLRDRRLGRTYRHRFHARGLRPYRAPAGAGALPHAQRPRDAGPGAAGPHPYPASGVEGVHAAHGGAVEAVRARAGGRSGGPAGGGGRRRPAAGRGRAAPGRRDRRDAGHPGVRPCPAAALVGGDLRDVRAEPVRGDGGEGGPRVGRVLGVPARTDRGPPQGTGRRPDLGPDRGPRRGRRPAHRAGDDLDLRPAPERGPRGHGERHDQRLAGPVPQSGPAGDPARRPLPSSRRPWRS